MGIIGFIALLFGLVIPSDTGGADTSRVQANLKHMVNAIESCAASRVDGTYSGPLPGADDCLDPAVLLDMEPALADLSPDTGPPVPGGYHVSPIDDGGAGFMVQGSTEGSPTVYYAELHQPDGSISKLCGTKPFTATGTGGGDRDAPGCDDGTW